VICARRRGKGLWKKRGKIKERNPRLWVRTKSEIKRKVPYFYWGFRVTKHLHSAKASFKRSRGRKKKLKPPIPVKKAWEQSGIQQKKHCNQFAPESEKKAKEENQLEKKKQEKEWAFAGAVRAEGKSEDKDQESSLRRPPKGREKCFGGGKSGGYPAKARGSVRGGVNACATASNAWGHNEKGPEVRRGHHLGVPAKKP